MLFLCLPFLMKSNEYKKQMLIVSIIEGLGKCQHLEKKCD